MVDYNLKGKKVVITGGCGFIGSNLINYLTKNEPELNLLNIDKLTYAGNLLNIQESLDNPKHTFHKADISNEKEIDKIFKEFQPDYVINLAAETHVDRSIHDSKPFYNSNILGTLNLLHSSLKYKVKRYLQVSTDEVYGSLDDDDGSFTENSPIDPSSPYSATKAASDFLVNAFHKTYGMDTIITRCSNNYGPFQFPEKLIPLMIINTIEQRRLPVYGNGMNIRDWLFVDDHCSGIISALVCGQAGEVYNFGGENEITNIDLIRKILSHFDAPESLIKFVDDRPGHDYRYAMNISKAKNELEWRPVTDFSAGLDYTIQWYMANSSWIKSVITKEYLEYYKDHYKKGETK